MKLRLRLIPPIGVKMPKIADDIQALKTAVIKLTDELNKHRRWTRWIVFILASGLVATWIRS